jgi:predicted DNA-binding protein with PD1-like motif
MKAHPMRLQPGAEIKSSLLEFVTSRQLNAAFILTCCGSIRKATLRFATSADQTHKVCFMNYASQSSHDYKKKKKPSMVSVRERTIPTERPPLVGEVIANFCG